MRQSAVNGEVKIITDLARGDITREENWAQAYICVAARAGGIMWFHFDAARPKWDDCLQLVRLSIGVSRNSFRSLRFEEDST